ncbi:MAG: BON domain-containing protein [bacterium]
MSPQRIARNLMETINDKILALDVRASLERSPHPQDFSSVTVTIKNGRAILTGTVGTWKSYVAAGVLTQKVQDVLNVDNRLLVAPTGERRPIGTSTSYQRPLREEILHSS